MGINRKDIHLLEKTKNKISPVKSFAKGFGESERNIRYRIENLNFYLKKYLNKEISIKNGSIENFISDSELDKFISNLTIDEYILSQEEREKYILVNYLFTQDTTLKDIQSFCDVSRTTVKKDLKSLNTFLSTYSLSFLLDKNQLIITGNEKKLRHLKLLILIEYAELKENKIKLKKYQYFFNKKESNLIQEYFNTFFLEKIITTINEIEKNLKISFSSKFRNLMIFYLTTTLERVNHGYLITKKNNGEFLRKLEEYSLIKKSLSQLIDPKLEFEFLHLTEYFLSGFYNESFSENILIVEGFISKLLEELENTLGIQLLNNRKLGQKLLEYLVPAVYRIKNNFTLNSSVTWENLNFKNISIITKAISNNVKYLDEPLREEEIYHLTKIISNFTQNINSEKIPLKELISIIQKYSKDCNINKLSQALINKFEKTILDDRSKDSDFGILHYLKAENIKILDQKIKLIEAVNVGLNSLYEEKYIKSINSYEISEFIQKFGRYMFIEKRVLFFYEKNKENCINSSLSMIISQEGIEVNNAENGNVLFVLFTKNKIEHLKIISELIYLLENKSFMAELLKIKNPTDVLNIISGYLSLK